MYILPITEDTNQSFSFFDGIRDIQVTIRCFDDERVQCFNETDQVGSIDIQVADFVGAFGLPLTPYTDIIAESVVSGCLPLDMGSFHIIPNLDGEYDCNALANGSASIIYLDSFTVHYILMLSHILGGAL